MHKLKIVTVCNGVAMPLVENWYAALLELGLGDRAVAFAFTEAAHRALQSSGIPSRFCPLPLPDEGLEYNHHQYRTLMLTKVALVRELLLQNKTVLYADADVVFLRDPTTYLSSAASASDVAIQKEHPANSSCHLCTGLFFAKPTSRSIRWLDISVDDLTATGHACDQTLLNSTIIPHAVRYVALPTKHFATDHVLPDLPSHKPYAIHFSASPCHEQKIESIKRYGLWRAG